MKIQSSPAMSIDDPRNGLLINKHAHHALSIVAAILPISQPLMDDSHAPNGRSGYYFQRFSPSNRYHPMNSHNWLLRQPESLEQWPTLTVFTMVYGAMALKYWGLPPCVERLRKTHSSDFYSPSVQRRSERQDEERQERLAERQKRRQEPDMLELLDVVSQSMRPRRPSHEAEQARQKREQREREESDRKVQDWLNESMDA